MPPTDRELATPPACASPRWAQALGALALAGLVALGAWWRMRAGLGDPRFDALQPEGLLRSDPALLYYFVERLIEARGSLPADFRADPKLRFPLETDVLGLFPLGIEWLAAWTHRLFDEPLHVACLRLASLAAASTLIGVYGLALELTQRVRWALVAAVLWMGLHANYRTVGLVLMGEDASLPLFALHLWLLARAVRLRTTGAIALATVALLLAASTWHAMGFVLALESAAVLGVYLITRRNPCAPRATWIALAACLVAGLAVPVLWNARFLASAPVLCLAALWLGARAPRAWFAGTRVAGAWGERALVLAILALLALLAQAAAWIWPGPLGGYSHVWGLLFAKLRFLGQLPDDPTQLAPEVRLMWQGPFATASPALIAGSLGVGLWLALAHLLRPAGAPRADRGLGIGLALLLGLALLAAWAVERTLILPGLLVPVAAVVAAEGPAWRRVRAFGAWCVPALFVALVGWQFAARGAELKHFSSSWYLPPEQRAALAALIEAVRAEVPLDQPVASDFVTSTALLAHTRRPIVLQPKYEDRESRERAIEYFDTFYNESTDTLRRLLTRRYRCRYLAVDAGLMATRAARDLGARAGPAPDAPSSLAAWLARPAAQRGPAPAGMKRLHPRLEAGRDGAGAGTWLFELEALE